MAKKRANYLSDKVTERSFGFSFILCAVGGMLSVQFGMTFFYVMASLSTVLFFFGLYRCYLTWKMLRAATKIIVEVDYVRMSVPNHRYVEFSYFYEGKTYPVKRDILDDEISDDGKMELMVDPKNPKDYRIVS